MEIRLQGYVVSIGRETKEGPRQSKEPFYRRDGLVEDILFAGHDLLETEIAEGLLSSRWRLPDRNKWSTFAFGDGVGHHIDIRRAIELFGLDRLNQELFNYTRRESPKIQFEYVASTGFEDPLYLDDLKKPVGVPVFDDVDTYSFPEGQVVIDRRITEDSFEEVTRPNRESTGVKRLIWSHLPLSISVNDPGIEGYPPKIVATTLVPGRAKQVSTSLDDTLSSLFQYFGRAFPINQYKQVVFAEWANPKIIQIGHKKSSQIIYTTAQISIWDRKKGGINYYCSIAPEGTITIQVGKPGIKHASNTMAAVFDSKGKLLRTGLVQNLWTPR